MNVSSIRESEWKKDSGEVVTTFYVRLDDGNNAVKEVPCYDAQAKTLETGKPLPAGWEVKLSQKGKEFLATPRKQGGGGGFGGAAAFRNTEAGQRVEQERMDRRTALMQAVAHADKAAYTAATVVHLADDFYTWLRSTGGSTGASRSAVMDALKGGTDKPQTTASSAAPPKIPSTGETDVVQEPEPQGEGVTGSCLHLKNTTPLTPNGKPLPAGKVRCQDCGTVFKALP